MLLRQLRLKVSPTSCSLRVRARPMKKLIDKSTSKQQLQSCVEFNAKLKPRYKNLLKYLNTLRILSYQCGQDEQNIFAAIKTIARHLEISERSVQRHLNYLMCEGYLYIRDEYIREPGRIYQTTSRYFLTQLILDPTNEALKAEILAEHKPRTSQAMGKGVKFRDLDLTKFAAPRLHRSRRPFLKKINFVTDSLDPVPKNYVSNSLSTNARVNVGIKAPVGASTPENSVFPSGGMDPLKTFEAQRAFSKLTDMLNLRGNSWQWRAFLKKWHETDMTYEKAMKLGAMIMADPSLVYTTTSPSRIFFLKDLLKIRKTIQKKQDSVYRTQENFGVWNGRDFERDSVVLRWFNYEDGLASQLLEHGLAERRAARRQAMRDSRHVAEEFHDPRLELITF